MQSERLGNRFYFYAYLVNETSMVVKSQDRGIDIHKNCGIIARLCAYAYARVFIFINFFLYLERIRVNLERLILSFFVLLSFFLIKETFIRGKENLFSFFIGKAKWIWQK